jgi:hypothetical protein
MSPARRLRLATGLVLFAYVTTHLVNHSLGLVSLAAMEAGRGWFLGIWRTLPGTVLLYGALLIHIGLAFGALYARRTLRMPRWEAAPLALGLGIPPLLMGHLFGTRVTWELYGVEDAYSRLSLALWAVTPELGRKQVLTLIVVWSHAMIGLHANAKLRRWYPRAAPWLLTAALLLPVLAILGFVNGGREAAALARDPAMRAELLWHGRAPLTVAEMERLRTLRELSWNRGISGSPQPQSEPDRTQAGQASSAPDSSASLASRARGVWYGGSVGSRDGGGRARGDGGGHQRPARPICSSTARPRRPYGFANVS